MKNFIITSKTIAVLSFALGTVLFTLQLYQVDSNNLISIGVLFIVAAAIINTISLIGLIFGLISYQYKYEVLKTIGIVLLNIPIAVLYFFLLIKFL